MDNRGNTGYQKWYCPNCSSLVSGAVEYSGAVNVKCRKCGVIMILNLNTRRKRTLTILVPDICPDLRGYYS